MPVSGRARLRTRRPGPRMHEPQLLLRRGRARPGLRSSRRAGLAAAPQALSPQPLGRSDLTAVRTVAVGAGGLDQRREVFEASFGEVGAQALATQLALAQVGVVVPVRSQR